MHRVAIRQEIVERVVARRGRLHAFEALDAKRTALLVIDMQNAFVARGAPVEVPAARDIVAPINRLAAALERGAKLHALWPELDARPEDPRVAKNRYSALIKGDFEDVLRKQGIDTLLIAGTKTNVCCECTARDAMMLDFKVVLLSDCTAALSDDEQRATLENVIQQFGDVRSADEALAMLS